MFEAGGTMEGSPTYSKGDIVWVKLSSYWWPGEVINEEDLPGDLLSDFKRPPLVIVKFFDEDSYEYVKNWSNINPYNFHKKNEFIKKGMAGFRSKLSHMSKFPKDIGTAEERTSGNPNILSQPEFLPVKKINYDDIFGTPSPKKSTKGRVSLPSTKKTPARDSNQPHITHRRFLGNDDYRAYICIQYPGKDRIWDSDDEEIKKLNEEPEKIHNCQSCSFKTKRLEVMILHTKMHIQGIYVTSKRKPKKSKGPDASDSESDTAVTKSPKPKQRKKKEVKPPKTTDVFTNLLEEWDDTDEEMEDTASVASKKPPKARKKVVQVEKLSPKNKKEENQIEKNDREINSTIKKASNSSDKAELVKPESSLKNTHDDIKNCFDFDEEEEDDDFLLPTSVGRKIPRVIPEKPKTSISELLEQSQKEDELEEEKISDSVVETEKQLDSTNCIENGTEVNQKEILRSSQNINRAPDVDENIENTFKELMAETELPALDDLAQNLKPEQNFHDARTVKFPDKGGTSLKGGTTCKGGTSRKRFITSFEDFEAGFRKLEDDQERIRKLGSDKEVIITKMPNAPQIQLDGGKDQTPIIPTDETTKSKGDNEDLKEVPSEKIKPVDTSNSTVEVPETDLSKRSQKTKRSAIIKETAEPQTDVMSTPSVEQKNAEQSDIVRSVGRRKTRQSDMDKSIETSLEQQGDVEEKKYGTSQEVIPDSRRKSSRRLTKQFVIEEDSEEIIDITKECDIDNVMDDSELIVGHLDEKAREKLAAMDLEIETLKESLESTRSTLEKDEVYPERSNEILDQTEKVIETSVEKIVEVASPKIVESITENYNLLEEIVESAGKTEDVESVQLSNVQDLQLSEVPKKPQRKTRHSSTSENLQKVYEQIKQITELTVPAAETPGKVKRKISHRTLSKKDPSSGLVEDLTAKSLVDSTVVEAQHLVEKSDSIAAESDEPATKGRRGRSRGHRKDVEIDLKGKEIVRSSQSEMDSTESKFADVLEEPAHSLLTVIESESVTKLVEPKINRKVSDQEDETLIPTSTEVNSDQNIEIQQAGDQLQQEVNSDQNIEIQQAEVQLVERETQDQLEKSNKGLLEPIAPEPTPRSYRGKSRKHSKGGQLSTTTPEENAPKDIKLIQPFVASSDVFQESAIQPTGSQIILPELASSSSAAISEPSTSKARRGRSQRYTKEEDELLAVREIIGIASVSGCEPKQDSTRITETDIVAQPANPVLEIHEPTPKTRRGRSRKFSKEKEHSTAFEESTYKDLEIEHKSDEKSSADMTAPDIPELTEELTLKQLRSRTLKNSNEREQVKSDVQKNELTAIISVTEQATDNLDVLPTVEQTSQSKNNILEPDICDFDNKTRDPLETKIKSKTEIDVALEPETEEVSFTDVTVLEGVNPLVESQSSEPLLSQPDLEISITKPRKGRTRKHTKEDQVLDAFDIQKNVESESIVPDPQKVSSSDVTVIEIVNPLVEKENTESILSRPDTEISVITPKKSRTRKQTEEEQRPDPIEEHMQKNAESVPIEYEPQNISSTAVTIPEDVNILAKSQNTDSMPAQPDTEVSAITPRTSRARRQTKEEQRPNSIEEHMRKNAESVPIESEPQNVSSTAVTIPKDDNLLAESQNTESMLSQPDTEVSVITPRKSSTRRKTKEEQRPNLIEEHMQKNAESVPIDSEPPNVSSSAVTIPEDVNLLAGSQNTESRLSRPDTEVSVITPRKSRTRRQTKEEQRPISIEEHMQKNAESVPIESEPQNVSSTAVTIPKDDNLLAESQNTESTLSQPDTEVSVITLRKSRTRRRTKEEQRPNLIEEHMQKNTESVPIESEPPNVPSSALTSPEDVNLLAESQNTESTLSQPDTEVSVITPRKSRTRRQPKEEQRPHLIEEHMQKNAESVPIESEPQNVYSTAVTIPENVNLLAVSQNTESMLSQPDTEVSVITPRKSSTRRKTKEEQRPNLIEEHMQKNTESVPIESEPPNVSSSAVTIPEDVNLLAESQNIESMLSRPDSEVSVITPRRSKTRKQTKEEQRPISIEEHMKKNAESVPIESEPQNVSSTAVTIPKDDNLLAESQNTESMLSQPDTEVSVITPRKSRTRRQTKEEQRPISIEEHMKKNAESVPIESEPQNVSSTAVTIPKDDNLLAESQNTELMLSQPDTEVSVITPRKSSTRRKTKEEQRPNLIEEHMQKNTESVPIESEPPNVSSSAVTIPEDVNLLAESQNIESMLSRPDSEVPVITPRRSRTRRQPKEEQRPNLIEEHMQKNAEVEPIESEPQNVSSTAVTIPEDVNLLAESQNTESMVSQPDTEVSVITPRKSRTRRQTKEEQRPNFIEEHMQKNAESVPIESEPQNVSSTAGTIPEDVNLLVESQNTESMVSQPDTEVSVITPRTSRTRRQTKEEQRPISIEEHMQENAESVPIESEPQNLSSRVETIPEHVNLLAESQNTESMLSQPDKERTVTKPRKGRTRRHTTKEDQELDAEKHKNVESEPIVPEPQTVSSVDKMAQETVNLLADRQNIESMLSQPDLEITVIKPRKSRSRRHTKEEQELNAEKQKNVGSEPILLELQKPSSADKTVQESVNILAEGQNIESKLSKPNLEITVIKPRKSRIRRHTKEDQESNTEKQKHVESEPSVLESHKVSSVDERAQESVNLLGERQNTDSMLFKPDLELTVTKRGKSRTRRHTKEDQELKAEEQKHVESEPIVLEPQKVSSVDEMAQESVNLLGARQNTDSMLSKPDLELTVIKRRKSRTRSHTKEAQDLNAEEQKHVESEPQKVSSVDETAQESVDLLDKRQNTESMLSQIDTNLSVIEPKKRRTRKHTKEEQVAVQEHVPKNVESELMEDNEITSNLAISDTKSLKDSQNSAPETLHSEPSIKNLEYFSKTRSRPQTLTKDETQLPTASQEAPLKDTVIQVQFNETVVPVDKTQNVETPIFDPVGEIYDESNLKVRRGSSRKSIQEDEIVEPELKEAGANLTVLGIIPQPADSQTAVLDTTDSDSVEKIINHPTPKARKSRGRKYVKADEVSSSLQKNIPKATSSKEIKESNKFSGSVKVSAKNQKALIHQVFSDSFAMPEEQFSKTRRGRSRKISKEEEDFARAIEESLKDIAQKQNQVETTIDQINTETGVQVSETDKSTADPVLSDSVVHEPEDSPRKSKKRKSRKHSKGKERVSIVLNDIASKDGVLESNQAATSADLVFSEKVAQLKENIVSKSVLSDSLPKAKRRKSWIHTSDQISTALEENSSKELAIDSKRVENLNVQKIGAHAVEMENVISKPSFGQSLQEISEQLTPSTRRGRTRKHAKEGRQNLTALSEPSTSIEPIPKQIEESTTGLTFSESASRVAKKQNILLEQAVETPEQSPLKSKRGKSRKLPTTAIEEISKVSNEIQSKELTAALEFTKTVLELVESQQTGLKTEEAANLVILDDSKQQNVPIEIPTHKSCGEISEEPVFKNRRGRSRIHMENEEVGAIALEENTSVDNISTIKQTQLEPASSQTSVVLESVSSDSTIDIFHELTFKTRKSKLRKNVKEQSTVDFKNSTSTDIDLKTHRDMEGTAEGLVVPDVVAHSINLNTAWNSIVPISETPDGTSSKTKKTRSLSHSTGDKTRSDVIEVSGSKSMELYSTQGQENTVDSAVPDAMEQPVDNPNTLLEPEPNSTKMLEELTSKTKRGKLRKHIVEENSESTIKECEPLNLEPEPKLAAATALRLETQGAVIPESKRARSRKYVDQKNMKDDGGADMGSMGSIIQKAIDQSVATLDTIPKSGLSEWVGELLKISTSKEEGRFKTNEKEDISNQDHDIPKPTQLEVHIDGSTVQKTAQLFSDYHVSYLGPSSSDFKRDEKECDAYINKDSKQQIEMYKLNQSKVVTSPSFGSHTSMDITEVNQPKSLSTRIEYGATKSTMPTTEISEDTDTKNKRRISKESLAEESISALETKQINATDVQEIATVCVKPELECEKAAVGQFGTVFGISSPDQTENSKSIQDTKLVSDTAMETTSVKMNEKPTVKGKRRRSRKSLSGEFSPIQERLTDPNTSVPISILQSKDERQGTSFEERKSASRLENLKSEVDTSRHHKLGHRKVKILELNQLESEILIDSTVQKPLERSVETSEFALSPYVLEKSPKGKRRKSRWSGGEEATSILESGQLKEVPPVLELTEDLEQKTEEHLSDKNLNLVATSEESVIDEHKEKNIGNLETIVSTSPDLVDNDIKSSVDNEKVQISPNAVVQSYINTEKLEDSNLANQVTEPDLTTLVQLPEVVPVVQSTTLESDFQKLPKDMTPSNKHQGVVHDIAEQGTDEYEMVEEEMKSKNRKSSVSVQDETVAPAIIKDIVLPEFKSRNSRATTHSQNSSTLSKPLQESEVNQEKLEANQSIQDQQIVEAELENVNFTDANITEVTESTHFKNSISLEPLANVDCIVKIATSEVNSTDPSKNADRSLSPLTGNPIGQVTEEFLVSQPFKNSENSDKNSGSFKDETEDFSDTFVRRKKHEKLSSDKDVLIEQDEITFLVKEDDLGPSLKQPLDESANCEVPPVETPEVEPFPVVGVRTPFENPARQPVDQQETFNTKLDVEVLESAKTKLSTIETRIPEDVLESHSLIETPQDRTGAMDKVSDLKRVLSEETKRHVPPKKSRWSRRGSYAKKEHTDDSDLLQEQIVKCVPEPAVSEEVVIEEQIVEIDNDVIETNTIVSESECVVDPNEDKHLLENTEVTETNHPGNVSGISGRSFSDLNDSEIILPPKKSKRVNEAKFNFLNDSFSSGTFSFEKRGDSDHLSFPSCDDSIMSTSLRNNIEGLIKDIDNFDNSCVSDTFNKTIENDGEKVSISDITKVEEIKSEVNVFSLTDSRECIKGPADISKCVPPKKKKIEFSTQEVNSTITSLLQNDILKSEGKLADAIPRPPKKKIQKLFESSQMAEKLGKVTDIPQMSPLAKKKSFLFHQEEFAQSQKLTEISQHTDVIPINEPPNTNDLNKDISETAPLDSTIVKTKEGPVSPLDSHEAIIDIHKYSTLPKKRQKRKSSYHGDHSEKKERRTSTETVDTNDGPEEKQGLDTEKSSPGNISAFSTPVDENQKITDEHTNEMEVKLEEDDFKFCIQTNLSNIATSTAEELSAIATATLSEMKNEIIVESPDLTVPLTSKEIEQDEQAATTVKDEEDQIVIKEETVAPLESIMLGGVEVSDESQFVPISLNPTVMSETDLADAQVEITTDKVISEKKTTSMGMFSMDFLESSRPSKRMSLKLMKNEIGSQKITNTVGTEFTSKAMTKEFDNRPLITQPKAYALKSELLDILEGNSNSSTNSSGSDQKFKTSFDNYDKQTVVQGMFDFEEAIPSQIVLSNKIDPETVLMDSPRLLERLSMTSDGTKINPKKVVIQSNIKVSEGISKGFITKIKPIGTPKPGQKIVIKTPKAQVSSVSKATGNKPIILSEQIIRPANALKALKPAIQPQGLKRQYEDIEDVETAFIIPKIAKKSTEEEVIVPITPEKPPRARNAKGSGKAKILQQTIITPKGEIIQPQTPTTTSAHVQSVQAQPDDTVFDINSMPIVISDDILTPESIQNMSVVLSEEVLPHSKPIGVKAEEKVLTTLAKKVVPTVVSKHQQIVFKTTPSTTTPLPAKQMTKPRILSTAPASINKVPKSCTPALLATGTSADGKPTKYVLVPSTVTSTIPQVKTVKPPIIKKQLPVQSKLTSIQTSEPPSQIVGNKIMIVTNQHGQQTRVVLTPQQQKAFMQAQPGSKTKTIIKGAIPKALLESAAAGPSGIVQKPVSSVPQGITSTVSSQGGLLMTVGKCIKTPVQPKKATPRMPSKPQKTILIKNQMGQTVRKIQGTDDADLDRQVAEQLEAIKASARLQQANKSPEIINYTNRHIASSTSSNKATFRRSYSKKIDPVKVKPHVPTTLQAQPQKSPEALVPALAPLSPQPKIPQVQSHSSSNLPKQPPLKVETSPSSPVNKAVDAVLQQQATVAIKSEGKATSAQPASAENKPTDRPLTQLVIQDGLGNQTTITEGQILAIPSETVDGQPQSYMLVTLDEMGNITPLNNEALMSLDPSLGLGGDLNNMVLQVDQGQGTVAALKPAEQSLPIVSAIEQKKVEERLHLEPPKISQPAPEPKPEPMEQPKPQEVPLAVEQQIVIGEGVLPGADAGGQQLIVTGDPIATQKFLESLSDGTTDLANILANAEGGSVLIQADGQQILIKTNTGSQPLLGIAESTEGGGNPIFGTHKPNQDILAAALANTDVFQPSDQPVVHSSPVKGLQSSQLSPGGGAGVLYPMHVGNVLETSLTLSSPIMTPLEVPSLPNKKIDDDVDILSQIPKNVDLPITITDPNISQTVAHQTIGLMELTLPMVETTGSSDINSPSYTYSLPTLDEPVGHAQKPFNGSMPLLTEDVTEMESSGSSQIGKIRVAKGLQNIESDFSSNFGSLPMLPETIESSREEVVKTTCFGDMGSMPMLTEDVIEDSGSSIGSSKPPRSSPKSIERDIVDEGLSTLGGEMCSSLSEPPPDMFDLASITPKEEEISSDMSSIPEPEGETLSLHSDNSGEIPLQPPIVANLSDLKRPGEDVLEQDEKRQKFD